MKNYCLQLKKVLIHKWWVLYYSFKLGIPFQGIMHDLSKFCPEELCESAKFYQGDKSPIPVAKQEQGYSRAWLHHKGTNKHHFEYWVDINENGDLLIAPMPYKYVLELVVDWLGAFRAYNGYENIHEEYMWWINKRDNVKIMHPATKELIDNILDSLSYSTSHDLSFTYYPSKNWYDYLLLKGEKVHILKK